jgi:hypothetical protein
MDLFGNPLILILMVVGAVVPIFNGKTLLQIVLDMLIPKPPAPSAQAWDHYTGLARQALARGDNEAAERFANQAATEAAKYRDAEMQFEPGTIIQWVMKLITGGAGGGMMPLLLIGGVLFLVMSGGCPKEMSPIPIDDAEVQAAGLSPIRFCSINAGPIAVQPPAAIPVDPTPPPLTVLVAEPAEKPPAKIADDPGFVALSGPVCNLATRVCTVRSTPAVAQRKVYLFRPRTWGNRSVFLVRPRTWRIWR